MEHIAQMNMGYLLHPLGDPRIAGFEDNSDRLNAVADRSKGFIWRLQGEGYDLPENDMGALFGRPQVALNGLVTRIPSRLIDIAEYLESIQSPKPERYVP